MAFFANFATFLVISLSIFLRLIWNWY